MTSRGSAPSFAAVGALFFFSGAASLVYEVLWFRLLLLKLGGTGLSVATVTAAFMTGLGLGAWLLGTRLARGVRPLALYGILEIGIGAYVLLSPLLISLAGRLDAWMLGAEPGLAGRVLSFALAGIVLVPPTMCMGGTLPVLARLVEGGDGKPASWIGLLYGLNTTGAVLGAGATGFALLPGIGLSRTLLLAAAGNVALGLVAIALSRQAAAETDRRTQAERVGEASEETPRLALAVAASSVSGLVSFVLQVSWTRILALVFGSSVYAFSLILVIFLLGLGGGALAGAWACGRTRNARDGLAWCFLSAGGFALLGQGLVGLLPRLYLGALVSAGGRQALGSASWMAAALMLPTTLFLGAAFPFVVRLATGDRRAGASAGVGRVYAGNTAGGVVGAFTAALVLVPALGLAGAASLAALVLLALGTAIGWTGRADRPGPRVSSMTRAAAAVALVAAWLLAVPGWDRNVMSMGVALWGPRAHADGRDVFRDLASLREDRVRYYRDGVTATVAVKEAPLAGGAVHRYMTVDGHIDASNGSDMPTQVLLGQLPILAARSRKADVMVVGYASGVTAGSVLTHPVESLTVVEIEERVRDASHAFDDVNGRPLDDARVRFVANDARAYLERTDRSFDVIVSEPSSVWLTGPSKLFTRETFERIRARLKPGGILGQWVHTYDLTEEDIFTVLRTVRLVFPHVAVAQLLAGADLLLLASQEPIRIDLAALDAALTEVRVAEDLDRVGVRGVCGILDRVVAESEAVAAAVPPGAVNTDDNALLEYHGALIARATGEAGTLARLVARARGGAALLAGQGVTPERLSSLAASCVSAEMPNAARSLAERRLEQGPDAASFWVLGEILRGEGDRAKALDRFAEAVRVDPAHVSTRISTAMTLQEMDRLEEALVAWEQAVRFASTEPLVHANRGIVRLLLRDYRGAASDFVRSRELASGRPVPIPLDLYEASALQESGKLADARRLLERYVAGLAPASSTEPPGVAGLERLSRALFEAPGQQQRAREMARRAAEGRGALAPQILSEAARLSAEGNEAGARAYLRGLMATDPALSAVLVAVASQIEQAVPRAALEQILGELRAR